MTHRNAWDQEGMLIRPKWPLSLLVTSVIIPPMDRKGEELHLGDQWWINCMRRGCVCPLCMFVCKLHPGKSAMHMFLQVHVCTVYLCTCTHVMIQFVHVQYWRWESFPCLTVSHKFPQETSCPDSSVVIIHVWKFLWLYLGDNHVPW